MNYHNTHLQFIQISSYLFRDICFLLYLVYISIIITMLIVARFEYFMFIKLSVINIFFFYKHTFYVHPSNMYANRYNNNIQVLLIWFAIRKCGIFIYTIIMFSSQICAYQLSASLFISKTHFYYLSRGEQLYKQSFIRYTGFLEYDVAKIIKNTLEP